MNALKHPDDGRSRLAAATSSPLEIPVLPFNLVDPRLGEPAEVRVVPGARSRLNLTVATITGWRPLKADVHLPADGAGPFPVVVYAHGGGLVGGVKEMGCWASLPAQGIAVVSVDYRLAGEVGYPEPVEDIVTTVRWVRARGEALGLDPGRVAAWGSSAGGYLVGRMAFADGQSLGQPAPELAGLSAELDAVVLHYPVTDFLALLGQVGERGRAAVQATIERFFGTPPGTELSVVEHGSTVSAARRARRLPPLVLAHGDADVTVPHAQSVALHEAVTAAGGASTLTIVAGETHASPAFAAASIVQPAVDTLWQVWRPST